MTLLIPKTPVIKDKAHLAFVHCLPCVCTGYEGQEIVAHHLLRLCNNERGAGRKPGDDWILPLRDSVHVQLHHCGTDEREFLAGFGIYGPALAALLYRLSGNEHACRRAISEYRQSQGMEDERH